MLALLTPELTVRRAATRLPPAVRVRAAVSPGALLSQAVTLTSTSSA